MLKEWLKWDSASEKLESISIALLIISSVLTVVGISIGVFVPGFPVMLVITGAFLVVVSIVFYISSEFAGMLEKKSE